MAGEKMESKHWGGRFTLLRAPTVSKVLVFANSIEIVSYPYIPGDRLALGSKL
jgi:hypothetical protein